MTTLWSRLAGQGLVLPARRVAPTDDNQPYFLY
jgi:hypothetical protein